MFSSITAPWIARWRRPLFYTYAWRTASGALHQQRDSDPVCGSCHDTRDPPHELARGMRQLRSTRSARRRAVPDLIGAHHRQYLTAAIIRGRQPAQMLVQVAFDLTLGLHDEAQTDSVTCDRCECPDGE